MPHAGRGALHGRVIGGRLTLVAIAFGSSSACSIWAALDDPYKSDTTGQGDAQVDGTTTADSGHDAGSHDAGAPRVEVLDAGFTPYALAVRDDTLYVVDSRASVHVAYDATTDFTTFWRSDGGETFDTLVNGIAASSAGVFWTVSAAVNAGAGVHYCALDGGDCGFVAAAGARAIAAGGPVVAWIDDLGVHVCTAPPADCVAQALGGSKSAASIAVGPTGTVAWTDGGHVVSLVDDSTSTAVATADEVAGLASDDFSSNLYWIGQNDVGFLPFEGGVQTVSPLQELAKPVVVFAAHEVVYWSLRGNAEVLYCRYGATSPSCAPIQMLANPVAQPTMSDGIGATSRDVFGIVDSNVSTTLVAWPLP